MHLFFLFFTIFTPFKKKKSFLQKIYFETYCCNFFKLKYSLVIS